MNTRLAVLTAIGFLAVISCAPATTAPSRTTDDTLRTPSQPSRVLRIVVRAEPGSIGGTILLPTGISTGSQRRIFNAGLTFDDSDAQPRPYLAEGLPQLNTDSWRVSPDGRMETAYRLRANLTWHDGNPITAADFVFARTVYTNPAFGLAASIPHALIAEVQAPDAQTVVLRWNQPYPEAAELDLQEFAPLPRHILQPIYEAERDNLPNHAFWTTEFVGAGPYRVGRWEPGAFIEASAFDRHVLGRAKIDRIQITWSADFNATLATLIAGGADMPADDSIRVEQGLVLEREWAARNAGTVTYRPQLPRLIQVQHRAEYANPSAVRDIRVRRALAHAIDKPVINETLFDGKGITSDSLILPTLPNFAEVDRAIARYPLDLRRAEQLTNEAGFTKDTSGSFVDRTGARLNFEVRNIQSAQNDAERSIIADGWRRAGFEIDEDVFTPVQTRDGQLLGTFRALSITSAAASRQGITLQDYRSAAVSGPETRWLGANRGGWSNPTYDRAVSAFLTVLEPTQRAQAVVEAAKVLTEDLGFIPLHFNPQAIAYAAGISGVGARAPSTDLSWNIHEWRFV